MRIITEPFVELIAVTRWLGSSRRAIPDDPAASEATKLGAFAAKGCYDSHGADGRSCVENQRELIAHRHGSVLEHFNLTFWVEGISRACSHEMVRHRAGFGYSQRSTRYTKEEDASIVLEPYLAELHKKQAGSLTNQWEDRVLSDHLSSAEAAVACYAEQVRQLVDLNPNGLEGFSLRKWARGKARNVLPHCLETRMTMTGNIRAWRHFIEMRSERFAEAEIRRLAAAIFPFLKQAAPDHFGDYFSETVDGFPEYSTLYKKV